MHYTDALITAVLNETKTIAVVGASANPARPSHSVTRWLIGCGYRVFCVNPGLSGTLLGVPVVPSLTAIPEPIDMVDVFRTSEAAAAVVEEALALTVRPKVIWMQLGVINTEASARAEASGVTVIMDRCPVIEAARLSRPA